MKTDEILKKFEEIIEEIRKKKRQEMNVKEKLKDINSLDELKRTITDYAMASDAETYYLYGKELVEEVYQDIVYYISKNKNLDISILEFFDNHYRVYSDPIY